MRNILAILLLLGLSLRAADVPLSSQTRTAYIHPLNTLVAVSTNLSSTYYSRAINASNFLESILTYPNWPSLTKVQTTNLVNTTVNLASNALQTQITAILSATNFANVIDYGATADGSSLASPGTDDTAAFANAIASGQAVYVPKTAGYFSITNLTNSTLIFGGGRILMRPTSTNFAIYFGMMAHSGNGYAGTNVDWSGIGMQDIELWGGGTNFLGGLGNRHGVNFNPYGQGNILQNCYIHGFNGVGVQSTSTKPFAGVPPFLDIDQAPGVLNNVTVSNCYYGFHYVGGQPVGIPASSDVYLSEYLRSQGLMATGNKVGMWLEAGNNQIMNSHFSRNTNGFLITSNQNNGHGAFIGGSINHNDGSGVIASNISFGFVFQGVNMFFNSLYLTNCDGILYQGGIFDNGTVTFGGGGANVFRDNEWLTGAPSIVTTASGKGVAYNYGPADGSALPVAFPWYLMSTNQHVVRSTNGFFSSSTNKGAFVVGGNYSPTIAENVFNGNSAFNIQANMGYNGAFTFDAVGANRVGFTIRNGFYPWLTWGTNVPFYLGESGLSDLQTLSANPTYANRAYMSFMGSKITNHVDTAFLGNVAVVGTGTSTFLLGTGNVYGVSVATPSTPTTNGLGVKFFASASVQEIAPGSYNDWQMTNNAGAAITLVFTNAWAGQWGSVKLPGAAAGGSDYGVTIIQPLGEQVRFHFATNGATTFTRTNGQDCQLEYWFTRLNTTNVLNCALGRAIQ